MKRSKINFFKRKYCLNCNSKPNRGRQSNLQLPPNYNRRRSKTLDSDLASIIASDFASVLIPPRTSTHSHVFISAISNLKTEVGSFLHTMKDLIRVQSGPKHSQKSFEEIVEQNSQMIQADPREKYRILTMLGQGAFGCVYQVKDMDTGEDYAIKRISPTTEELKQDILQEIALLKICDHQNILKLYDSYECEG